MFWYVSISLLFSLKYLLSVSTLAVANLKFFSIFSKLQYFFTLLIASSFVSLADIIKLRFVLSPGFIFTVCLIAIIGSKLKFIFFEKTAVPPCA